MTEFLPNGVFIGAVVVDSIYLSPHALAANQKLTALDWAIAAGGPATNAAVAFAALGGNAKLWGSLGTHSFAQLARADLAARGVCFEDFNAEATEPPAIASIVVARDTGDRSAISIGSSRVRIPAGDFMPERLDEAAIVLADGHQMALSEVALREARSRGIATAIDGGSWKPGFEKLLPFVDFAICSADFHPPGCGDRQEVFDYLASCDIPHIAITAGDRPIEFFSHGRRGTVAVPTANAIDTLGAGDIFHGSFCRAILSDRARGNFEAALSEAARIASRSCEFFGTRAWIDALDSP